MCCALCVREKEGLRVPSPGTSVPEVLLARVCAGSLAGFSFPTRGPPLLPSWQSSWFSSRGRCASWKHAGLPSQQPGSALRVCPCTHSRRGAASTVSECVWALSAAAGSRRGPPSFRGRRQEATKGLDCGTCRPTHTCSGRHIPRAAGCGVQPCPAVGQHAWAGASSGCLLLCVCMRV